MRLFHNFLKPSSVIKLSTVLLPWIWSLSLGLLSWGVTAALWYSPPDYQQGELVRLLYLHVPASWLGLGLYSAMGIGALLFLVTTNPVLFTLSRSCARVGLMFTSLSLGTGMIWGRPVWGTWWVWDARLTSMLVLWLMYLGYILLEAAYDERQRAEKPVSVLAVIGLINVPIVKFSVQWWHTLHQPPSVGRLGRPALAPEMLNCLILMALGLGLYALGIVLWSARAQLQQRKLNARAATALQPPRQSYVNYMAPESDCKRSQRGE